MKYPNKNFVDEKKIFIKGARVHNLKNVDVELPKNKFIVITGVSGSGKSSLTIDTLYAEGQRRYVESLSSYARQFLTRMDKPDVDYIKGLCPAIAIEQKVSTRTTRSTVGSLTEIYDYLRLLFARIGKTFSPVSGDVVVKHEIRDVIDFIFALPADEKVFIYFDNPIQKTVAEDLKLLLQKGFTRVKIGEEIAKIEELLNPQPPKGSFPNLNPTGKDAASNKHPRKGKPLQGAGGIKVLVDRLIVTPADDDLKSRAADSVQTAFNEGHGQCIIEYESTPLTPLKGNSLAANGSRTSIQSDSKSISRDSGKKQDARQGNPPSAEAGGDKDSPFRGVGGGVRAFSNKFEADGITFEEPNPNFFNFNNPYGACKTCEGFGSVIGLDEDLIFPDKELSVYEGCVAPWRGEKMSEWAEPLIKKGVMFDFPIHRAYKDLNEKEKHLLWTGNEYFKGLNYFFQYLEEKSYKIQYRVMLSRYRGKTTCPDCNGSRIRKDAQYVRINGRNISELLLMPIKELHVWINNLTLTDSETKIATRILAEIRNRVQTMMDVGLGYLTLIRLSNTLSGGETQRINLTRSIGSNLTSSLYILDEPSIGLHQRDTDRLIKVLKNLRNLGNTVVIVEHDEDIMKNSDHIVDMGPEAGILGGEVMFNGDARDILKAKTLTAKYLNGQLHIPYSHKRRKPANWIEITGATQHNLKNIDVKFPLNALTIVTGVSGSGKTTLVKKILYPAMLRLFDGAGEKPGAYKDLKGDLKRISSVEMIDQNPLGRSSRSNPITYVKAYDSIRDLFAQQQLSKIRGYQPKDFSFNVEGGRCENCKGEGEVVVEMQFLADVHLKCEVCNGKKFKEEILEVQYNGKNIYEVLELSVDEAIEFFTPKSPDGDKSTNRDVVTKIRPLQNVGLGYVKIGQSSSTLSGGEAQRVKLASFLSKGAAPDPVLFIFDEPTTGLHFHDINKLLSAFNQLIEAGHSVVVIEHNMDVIKCADWLIDLGPEGGDEGGYLVYQGEPEGILSVKKSFTAQYLRPKLTAQKN